VWEALIKGYVQPTDEVVSKWDLLFEWMPRGASTRIDVRTRGERKS